MNENFKFPNQFLNTQFVPYMKKGEIKSLVGPLANIISKKYGGQELIILGVLKGGFIFTADLVRKLHGVHPIIDFIKLSDMGRTCDSDGTIRIEKDIKVDIKNKNVLIVEDIVDSGRALKFIQQRLELAGPRSVEVITLFNKPSRRKEQVQVDYIGKEVKTRFIVGFGLDLEGHGRNLEDVYYLKYPN